VGELAGYPLQLTLVDIFGFLFSDISVLDHHTADDPFGVLPCSCLSENLFVLIVDICLCGAHFRVNNARPLRPTAEQKPPNKSAAAKWT